MSIGSHIICLLAAGFSTIQAGTAAAQAVNSPDTSAAIVTRHSGRFNGQKVQYRALVETTDVVVSGLAGGARIVSFAYLADGDRRGQRPIIFLFNGGPIVPSIWLHIGAFGPKRVVVPPDLSAPASRYVLFDNPDSVLDVADLVFIDPATTGYSETLPGTPPGAFHSVDADARQTSEFIARWLRDHGRSSSPFYILGESYGTIRAPVTARLLAERPQPLLATGLILLGQATNIVEYVQRSGNIMSFVASLPTEAAVAWHHGRVRKEGTDFARFVREADDFAQHAYLDALNQGNLLPEAERQKIAERLSGYIGISADWLMEHDLRITKQQFRVELLRDRGLLLGQVDARYAAPITDKGATADPAGVIDDGFATLWQRYLESDLRAARATPYRMIGDVSGGLEAWNWGGASPFSDWPWPQEISKMMRLKPDFRVMVGNGWSDMQTTVGAAELLLRQAGWPRDRSELHVYDGGHMFYTVDTSATAVTKDVRRFVSTGEAAK
ncbi:S10 family peptidase [Sphingomonas carotinifaciens]|uniref:Carboxypeptidase C (Cathepsin A) n=1 Tax=Sphingomonas carotinifaciens TaxID=1166323 RepID=A0A1G7Q2L5_9SPHN|nr:peptidase S10 [Sphingomonas carotinifaciens]MBB4087579.1 carboxypeptidase C (cathepsin A) [Sphingomonas carotinifaciens]MWC45663.1 peptidase S10 [Sphingomonas carotinifaciens]SDF91850.1 Carboxypeptidase C (cathepsin A) [Sphingomonas carotinifaciens]